MGSSMFATQSTGFRASAMHTFSYRSMQNIGSDESVTA